VTSVLVVEDDPKIRAHLLFQLRDEAYSPIAAESAEEALLHLDAGRPDLLLLDVRLPGMSGIDLVRRLASEGRLPPTVILSGEASVTEAVEALRLGVHDFLEKPFRKEKLLLSLSNALESSALKREVARLRTALDQETEILGRSQSIDQLRQRITQAAPTDARILILGESGTGKELVADALHQASSRRDGPFIKINCAAIPDHLVEAELFGHAQGAFTDARTAKAGLFEEADGGTLFLDEIGDMEVRLQARLLRVLEDGRVRRLGEVKDREVDVRVLAATHANLDDAVREGRFREDLYFRLAHLPLEVPPLRERPGDVRLLFEHFLETFVRRHRTRSLKVEDAVYAHLEGYLWPGNVRELKALAERLSIFAVDPLTLDQLPAAYLSPEARPRDKVLRLSPDEPLAPLREFRARCEKEYIEGVLRRTGWNVSAAARLLGIRRTHLHQKLNDLGTRRPEADEKG